MEVNVKMSKGQIAHYNKTVSEGEANNKVIKDRSWFERGTLLLISGIRQGDTFKCKKYSNSVYGNHTIMKINKVNKDGTLRIQSERYQILMN